MLRTIARLIFMDWSARLQPQKNPYSPLVHPELCVYLSLTEGRGVGEGSIVIAEADSGRVIFAGSPHIISFGVNPLAVKGLAFRILDCIFPQAGLYRVEFRYNRKTIARQPLLVREAENGA